MGNFKYASLPEHEISNAKKGQVLTEIPVNRITGITLLPDSYVLIINYYKELKA